MLSILGNFTYFSIIFINLPMKNLHNWDLCNELVPLSIKTCFPRQECVGDASLEVGF